eukprot:1367363-Amorphochlora_amoeboformis.AAC.1
MMWVLLLLLYENDMGLLLHENDMGVTFAIAFEENDMGVTFVLAPEFDGFLRGESKRSKDIHTPFLTHI